MYFPFFCKKHLVSVTTFCLVQQSSRCAKQFLLYIFTTKTILSCHNYEKEMGVQIELWAWVFITLQISHKVQHRD